MARTYALVAPVQPVLYRVSCRNEILPNAPKYYEAQQNMSLGSNGVDRVHSLRKIRKRLHDTTCALIAPVQPVCNEFRVVMKHCQMHPNTTRRIKT